MVSVADYAQHWAGQPAPQHVEKTPKYSGPERRAQAHDRRWYAGQGGRRIFDLVIPVFTQDRDYLRSRIPRLT